MNVKKYLLIVTCTTFIFAIFSAGIIFFNWLHSDWGGGINMPDGTVDEHVEGLEEVEKSKPYNILLLGVDVEAKLTDVMMLCQINPVDHKVSMLSIPRDTRVKLGSRNIKINSSFSHGGVEQVIDCVKDLTGLPVHHYFLINTKAFRDTIDALGGVEKFRELACDRLSSEFRAQINLDETLKDLPLPSKYDYRSYFKGKQ